MNLKRSVVSGREAKGMLCVGVKGVEVRRNTGREGGWVDSNRH